MGRLRIPANITFNRDNWVHDIIIEKEINEEIEYPLCIKAKSGAYPEDCGGTYGYEEYCPSDNEIFDTKRKKSRIRSMCSIRIKFKTYKNV